MIPDKCSNSQISEGLKVLSTTKERIELLDQILHERQNQQQSAFQDKMKSTSMVYARDEIHFAESAVQIHQGAEQGDGRQLILTVSSEHPQAAA
jgi:hypothetical protein